MEQVCACMMFIFGVLRTGAACNEPDCPGEPECNRPTVRMLYPKVPERCLRGFTWGYWAKAVIVLMRGCKRLSLLFLRGHMLSIVPYR